MMYTALPRILLLFLLALLASPLAVQAEQGDPFSASSVVSLVLNGRINDLQDGVAKGNWDSENEGKLAHALLDGDGLSAVGEMEKLAQNSHTPADVRTVAWFHLYGYARLLDDRSQANKALAEVTASPRLADALFHGNIPAPMALNSPKASSSTSHTSTTGDYSVQIGAFGSKSNAQALAEKQAKRGFTVDVVPVKSGGKTLYAVQVGKFSSEADASTFGIRYYGTEGKDFRIVRR